MPGVIEIISIVCGVGGLSVSLWPHLREPLATNYAYLKNFPDILAELDKQNNKLWDKFVMVSNIELDDHIIMWRRKAGDLSSEVHKLLRSRDGIFSCAYSVIFPLRIHVAKRAGEKTKEIESLLDEGSRYIAAQGIPREIQLSTDLVGHNANQAVGKIFDFINQEDSYPGMIGVYGLSGAGKTATVKKALENFADRGNLPFDLIIWCDVQDESDDLLKIQKKLATEVGIVLSDEQDAQSNAQELLNALPGTGKFLLVLDDMSKAFSLEEIGIPQPTERNGCKLVIVSRFAMVCSRTSGGIFNIMQINLLADEEARDLFSRELNNGMALLPEATRRAMYDVTKECGGVPLVIIAVARALRDLSYGVSDWENAFSELRKSIKVGMTAEEQIIARLRFCYERLPHDSHINIKLCFLYCAMYPPNHPVVEEELMENWIWECLLGDVLHIDDKRKQAKRILKVIKDARLLESVPTHEKGEGVKMHAVIREMAIQIITTAMDSIFCSEAGSPILISQPSRFDCLKDAHNVSLMRADIKDLPNTLQLPECPQLSSLLLQYNPVDGSIGNDFFDAMPNLQVLNLSYTGIHVLPDSLSRSTRLQALFLSGCWNLTKIPSVSELLDLMVLDISDSPIEQLPEGMQSLTKLKRLVLTRTQKLTFPPGLMLAFRDSLQELLADNCGFLWQSSTSIVLKDVASVEELSHLQSLKVLEVNFLNSQAYHEYLVSRNPYQMRQFKFSVGGWYDGKSGKNSLAFMGGFAENGDPIPMPLDSLELRVGHCSSRNYLTSSALMHLKILKVCDCNELNYLFEKRHLEQFRFLEKISVKRCANIVELLKPGEDKYRQREILCPSLKKLTLVDLPNPERIHHIPLHCDNIKKITVWNCTKLMEFPVSLTRRFENIFSLYAIKKLRAQKRWMTSLSNDSYSMRRLQKMLVDEYNPKNKILYRMFSPIKGTGNPSYTGSEINEVVPSEGKATMTGFSPDIVIDM